MNSVDVVSLAGNLVAVCIGLLAIWLSIAFYRMSSEASKDTKEGAARIASGVERLEKLFDQLYSDTFSMMRETFSDIRKHMWQKDADGEGGVAQEAEEKADERIESLKKELGGEISKVLTRQDLAEAKLRSASQELSALLARGISQSRKAEQEARDETLRGGIVAFLGATRSRGMRANAGELVSRFGHSPTEMVLSELRRMREEGIIAWEGDSLTPDTRIDFQAGRADSRAVHL